MTKLTLRLGEHSFQIPKKPVIENSELFDAYPDLYDDPVYTIQSDVDLDVCHLFIDYLQSRNESLMTEDNCGALRELGVEFGDRDLVAVCERQQ
jgi:hypothetical protein